MKRSVELVLDKAEESCSCFSDYSSFVNGRDLPRRNTALHLSTHLPCQAIINLLLSRGAGPSLTAANCHGWEPLTRIPVKTLRKYLDGLLEADRVPMDSAFRVELKFKDLLPERRYHRFIYVYGMKVE